MQLKVQMEQLREMVRKDVLTPAPWILPLSFICLSIKRPDGAVDYLQCNYEDWNPQWQTALLKKRRGDIVKSVEGTEFKILGIFDRWEPGDTLKTKKTA